MAEYSQNSDVKKEEVDNSKEDKDVKRALSEMAGTLRTSMFAVHAGPLLNTTLKLLNSCCVAKRKNEIHFP